MAGKLGALTGRGKDPQSVVVRYEGGGEEDVTFEALAGLMAAADAIPRSSSRGGRTIPGHTTPHLTTQEASHVRGGAKINEEQPNKMPKTENYLICQRCVSGAASTAIKKGDRYFCVEGKGNEPPK
jgi:hypothetical protein